MTDYSLMGVVRVTWPICVLNVAPIISLELVIGTALQILFADWYIGVLMHASYITPKGMCDVSRDLLKFWETSDNISSAVQDRDIVAMKH